MGEDRRQRALVEAAGVSGDPQRLARLLRGRGAWRDRRLRPSCAGRGPRRRPRPGSATRSRPARSPGTRPRPRFGRAGRVPARRVVWAGSAASWMLGRPGVVSGWRATSRGPSGPRWMTISSSPSARAQWNSRCASDTPFALEPARSFKLTEPTLRSLRAACTRSGRRSLMFSWTGPSTGGLAPEHYSICMPRDRDATAGLLRLADDVAQEGLLDLARGHGHGGPARLALDTHERGPPH